MAIPVDYIRIGLNLSARGPSGTRAITFAVKYVDGALSEDYGSSGLTGFLVGRAAGDWWDAIKPNLATTTQLISVQISYSTGSVTVPVGSGPSGTMTPSDLAPPQMAIVGRWFTGTPGRKGRGRIFWPDVRESDFGIDGLMSGGASSRVIDAMNALAGASDDIVTGSFEEQALDGLHVLHADGSTPSRITLSGVNPQPGWLRRRGRA